MRQKAELSPAFEVKTWLSGKEDTAYEYETMALVNIEELLDFAVADTFLLLNFCLFFLFN